MKPVRGILGCMIAAATLAAFTPAHAQNNYPSRAIKIVVPYQAGGSTDMVVRKLAELASPKLGQPVIIENKGGAGATLGARTIANAPPDGYTLAILPSPVFRMPHMADTGYDPTKDFTYISMLSGYTLGVAVPATSPFKSWQDLVAHAKQNPGKISYGTASIGSASNVMMEEIAGRNGISWMHVPYKGESAVLVDVLGNRVDLYAGSTTVAPQVAAGGMRMLVIWGENRSPLYPGTPTLKELDGTPPMNAPFGIAGPKGLPQPILTKLQTVFKQIVESPEFAKILTEYGQEPAYMDSATYTEYAARAFEQEREIVKKLGLAGS
ncbi:MAG TPA: tripartite tricarboxylate transporter substrate binding protein [Noviherbaspirillum sp.]|nr:tripartite tricarboxylate transporter substrate binding protein [Noviherbaspirillum sp.]